MHISLNQILRPKRRAWPLLEKKYSMIILDEAKSVYNTDTQAHGVVSAMNADFRLCLTATPLLKQLAGFARLCNFMQVPVLGNKAYFNA